MSPDSGRLYLPPSRPGVLARVLRRAWPSAYCALRAARLAWRAESPLVQAGVVASWRTGRPCRADGSPAPWICTAMTGLLDGRLRRDLRVFEYGCGGSTAYFAARCAMVHSVEHDSAWAAAVTATLPGNATVLLRKDPATYAAAIDEDGGVWDLILVDGRHRLACCRAALPRLAPAGVLLLDDTDRDCYGEADTLFAGAGFRRLALKGLKPLHDAASQTTLYYRDGNCLGV